MLRALALDLAEIAALPIHQERAELWRKLNDLESARPMVWINEIPWHEMDVDGELTLKTTDPWAQDQERDLRRTLYQWRHLQGDIIVNDFIACPLAIHSTDFGIIEEVDVATTDDANDIVSREFHIQIRDFEDLEKIKMPVVTHNEAATEFRYQAMSEVYEGIMPVKKQGQTHVWYTPWDFLVRWWGVQEAMIDLVMRPDLVHAGVERVVSAWMIEMDQFEAMNLLSLDANNTRIGSGGYGYTRELPGDDYDPGWVKTRNMWGCSNAQIFSEVSPQMRWEFAVEHDLKWLERFGLTYYGCCEPLDQSIEVIKRIPNLRRSDHALGGHRVDGRADRYRLRHVPQAQSQRLCPRQLQSRARPGPAGRVPRRLEGLPPRTDHEGHLHRAIRPTAPMAMGRHRNRSGRGLRHLAYPAGHAALLVRSRGWLAPRRRYARHSG